MEKKENQEENKKSKKILIIIWSITLIVALAGASFAYFTAISESKPQVIITQSLSLSIISQNPGGTDVENIHPTDWSETMSNNENNKDIAKIPFTIASSSGVDGAYKIRLVTFIKENEARTGGSANDIKYRVYKNNKEISTGNFNAGDVNIEIANGTISADKDLNDEYMLYVYVENKNSKQDRLQDIKFTVTLHGDASFIG